MNGGFVETQWALLCDHLRGCAESIARDTQKKSVFLGQVQQFASQDTPDSYQALLVRTAAASHLAVAWQGERESNTAHVENMIDESEEESFPASDPPSSSRAHA
jgi:hypothetical protein